MRRKIGSKINQGISVEIYKWENNKKIIKLAKSKHDSQAIIGEYLNSQFAWKSGLSVPQPFELVEVYGRQGIVFERIYGDTLMKHFLNSFIRSIDTKHNIQVMNCKDIARLTAKILSEAHKTPAQNMSNQRRTIISSINHAHYLTTLERKSVVDVLNRLPIKHQLCHGDLNLNNILIKNNDNKAVLIDWMYASMGNPEADLAEFIITIKYGISLEKNHNRAVDYSNSIRQKLIKEFINTFIDRYAKLTDITYEDIDAWILPMAASRLSVGMISGYEKKQLAREIRRRLKKYN